MVFEPYRKTLIPKTVRKWRSFSSTGAIDLDNSAPNNIMDYFKKLSKEQLLEFIERNFKNVHFFKDNKITKDLTRKEYNIKRPKESEQEQYDYLKNLNKDELSELFESLRMVMDIEKKYLDDNCSMAMIGKKIGLEPNSFSHLLNKYFGGYAKFINFYRINEAVRLIHDFTVSDENVNFIEICFRAGFKSKTTFNRKFKALIGITPTEYKNKVMIKGW